jgi:transposase
MVDIEHRECPCCCGMLHVIGETRSEQLDVVPAQLRVRVTRRPRYACRTCEGAVVQAPAPERPIDGGLATEAMVVHVLVSKYCDSLPLHRQSKMLARQGIDRKRKASTSIDAVSPCADVLGLSRFEPAERKYVAGGSVLALRFRLAAMPSGRSCHWRLEVPGASSAIQYRQWCIIAEDLR